MKRGPVKKARKSDVVVTPPKSKDIAEFQNSLASETLANPNPSIELIS